ncbi:MAG TPA: hypothetical protein VER08_06160 [Pyrinomonadaceae bacterium]|nr:hypothetical protein [Pyrinomonadaceae bacterium]
MNKPVLSRRAVAASILAAVVAVVASLMATNSSAADKLSAEDLTAKHLESIGAAEARAAANSRIILGTARFTFRSGGSGMAEGNAVLASDGSKSLLSMHFGAPDYPHDVMGFNGKDFKVKDIRPGVRSILGEVFLRNGELFREGIVGGVLSSAWAMSNLAERSPKLDYAGTDKINGAEVHKVRYIPRKGSDYKITLFFDAQNFRHLRTQYDRNVAAPMGSIDSSAQQRETSIKIIEDFSDFRAEGKLTMPHSYKITYSAYGQNNGVTQEWAFTLSKYTFNEPIDKKAFDLVAE